MKHETFMKLIFLFTIFFNNVNSHLNHRIIVITLIVPCDKVTVGTLLDRPWRALVDRSRRGNFVLLESRTKCLDKAGCWYQLSRQMKWIPILYIQLEDNHTLFVIGSIRGCWVTFHVFDFFSILPPYIRLSAKDYL